MNDVVIHHIMKKDLQEADRIIRLTCMSKNSEKLIKFGINQIGRKHINSSVFLSKILIQHKSITNS